MQGAEQERAFLARVAKALGREQPHSSPPKREEVGPPAFWREFNLNNNEVLELFKKNLEALSGRVVVAPSAEAAREQVGEWLRELAVTSAVCWDNPELRQVLKIGFPGIELVYWEKGFDPNSLIDKAEKAGAGITWVDYAIAYTGSMAVFSQPNQGRSVSLLPPNHIAVFRRKQLVPTMSSVIRDITGRKGTPEMPSAINFITGPSRTSDIEMDLSIGVHGPYKTWVIIIDEH